MASHTVSQCLGFCGLGGTCTLLLPSEDPPGVGGSEGSGARAQWSTSAEATHSESAQRLTETWEVSALDLSKLFLGKE